MFKRSFVIIFFAFCCSISESTAGEHKITLESYLLHIPDTIGIWFTVENAYEGNNREKDKDLLSMLVEESRLSDMSSVNTVVDFLRQNIPNGEIRLSTTEPKVIHIIDTRLSKLNGYALDKTISTLDFSGKLEMLPDALVLFEPTILKHERQFILGKARRTDGATEVTIHSNNMIVRNVISNYLPFEKYKRILWVANTALESSLVEIQFSGQNEQTIPADRAKRTEEALKQLGSSRN